MKLSVFVVTYNQETYIRQCLDSIVMQKVDFEYEVIIGEDCSTDKTPQICDEYAKKYSFIHVYHHHQNLGLVKNWEFVLNHCSGEYVAMIEGDDYWTDKNKLQTQVNWLEIHREYVITSTNVNVVCEGEINDSEQWFPKRETGDVKMIEYLTPGICHTSSVVMRNLLYNIKYPSWIYMTDTYTFLLMSQKGRAFHFEKIMSSYRRHNSNTSSQSAFSQIEKVIKFAEQHKKMQNSFPCIKDELAKYELKDLELLALVPRTMWHKDLWKYRIRYMFKDKKRIFSKFLLRTVFYLPFFNKFN